MRPLNLRARAQWLCARMEYGRFIVLDWLIFWPSVALFRLVMLGSTSPRTIRTVKRCADRLAQVLYRD